MKIASKTNVLPRIVKRPRMMRKSASSTFFTVNSISYKLAAVELAFATAAAAAVAVTARPGLVTDVVWLKNVNDEKVSDEDEDETLNVVVLGVNSC